MASAIDALPNIQVKDLESHLTKLVAKFGRSTLLKLLSRQEHQEKQRTPQQLIDNAEQNKRG
jgi:hypothetical protein